jgi:hypothetical protein
MVYQYGRTLSNIMYIFHRGSTMLSIPAISLVFFASCRVYPHWVNGFHAIQTLEYLVGVLLIFSLAQPNQKIG